MVRPQRHRTTQPEIGSVSNPKRTSGRLGLVMKLRQGRRAERLGSASGGSADLLKIVREVRFLAGGDVRCLVRNDFVSRGCRSMNVLAQNLLSEVAALMPDR